VNHLGASALMAAAQAGHVAVVQKLTAAGAPLDRRLEDGRSALELAIEHDHVDVVAWLLDHGAKAQGPDRKPPILAAASNDSVNSIRLLIARGVDPNQLISVNETASISPLMMACVVKREAAMTALLDAGAKVNLVGKGGASALHMAGAAGSLGCAKLLLGRGATVDIRNDASGTPLRSAAESGSLEVLELLLARGADRNAKDAFGLLPVDYARKNGHAAIVKALTR
jgi:uncharacterized protein